MNLVGLAESPSRWLVLALTLVGASSCTFENPGTSPPPGKLAYPLSLALSSAQSEGKAKYLYVVNTNFDLRYNGASVQSYDLDELERRLGTDDCRPVAFEEPSDAAIDAGLDATADEAGADAGDAQVDASPGAGDAGDAGDAGAGDGAVDGGVPPDARIAAIDAGPREVVEGVTVRGRLCDGRLSPLDVEDDGRTHEGRCCYGDREELDALRASEIVIDSFASGMTSFATADGKDEFLYVPVRSRGKVLYVHADPANGELSCGEDDGRCQRGPSLHTKALTNPDEYFATQPSAVTSGSFHDLGIVDDKVDRDYRGFVATAHDKGQISLFGISRTGRPALIDVVQLATSERAVSLHVDPQTQFLYAGAVASASIERVGVRFGPVSELPVPYQAESLALNGLAGTLDVRDVLIDARPREAGQALRGYALIRGGGPGGYLQSVGFLELDALTQDGRFARGITAVRIGSGASKLVQAHIADRHLLFASCYDAGEIHVIDADRRQTVSVIRDVLGPFDMQIDAARRLMYVTDFRTSALRVVDLTSLYQHSSVPPIVVATLGVPTTPGSIR